MYPKHTTETGKSCPD